jgi:2-dehydro-3-deoxyphosphogluconate aldolase / (4S)-4-hydroxy-2-oxoglutarate aldolase
MARFRRMDVLNRILGIGVVPIFYNPDVDVAKRVLAACVEGGATVLEFTNRGDRAMHVFHQLIEFLDKEAPTAILGVGSVIDPGTAAMYINEGANFVVSPSLSADVAKICNRRKVAYVPGTGTESEISEAEEMGCEIIKIFPANTMGGPEFVKAVLAPCPWHNLMPAGGVDATEANLASWFKAGVACVGMGSNLIRKDWMKANNWAALTQTTADVIRWIAQIRAAK